MMNNNFLAGGLIPLKLADINTATINGKTVKEVTELIDAELDESMFEKTHDNYFYVPSGKLVQRLMEIVGPFRFTLVPIPVQYQEIRYTAVPNEKKVREKAEREKRNVSPEELETSECAAYLEKVITALVIYSDQGEAVTVKYAYGAAPYIFDGTSGRITSPCHVPQSAFSDANKRACIELGIGQKQLDKKNAKNGARKGSNGSGNNKQGLSYRIRITGQFNTVGNGYKAPAVITETGEQIYLLIWQQGIEKIEQSIPMSKFIKSYVDKEITVIGSLQTKRIRGKDEVQLELSSISAN